jgi:hypothetical protein
VCIFIWGGGLLLMSLTYYYHVAHIRRADYALLEGRVSANLVDHLSIGRYSSGESDNLTIQNLPFVIHCALPSPRPKPGDPGACLKLRPGDHVRVAYISPTRPGETKFRYRPEPLLIWVIEEWNMGVSSMKAGLQWASDQPDRQTDLVAHHDKRSLP